MPDPRFCAGCGVPIRIGGKTIHKPGCIRRLTMPDDVTLNTLEARAEADRQELEAWKRQAQELEAHADDYSQQNIGAAITAQMLLEIRETGQHKGTFGGEDIEKVAQAILADRQRIAELEAEVNRVAIYWSEIAGARGLRAEAAEAERDALRAALMSIGCEYAIPCVDMRAFYKPEHVFCTRCAALTTPAASQEEGS